MKTYVVVLIALFAFVHCVDGSDLSTKQEGPVKTEFREEEGYCRTANNGKGNPSYLKARDEAQCKNFCKSFSLCQAVEYREKDRECEIHYREKITKTTSDQNSKCMFINREEVTYKTHNSVQIDSIGNNNWRACKCTCPDGEAFGMVGKNRCKGWGKVEDCKRSRWQHLQTVVCKAPLEIIEELQKKNTDLTEDRNRLIKKAIKLNRKLLDLAEASKPKNMFGMVCDNNVKKSQNACFKHLEKCGENAIISWPIEWHVIHEHFDPKMHQHSNKSDTKVGKPIRRRLLEHTARTDLINLENLEYVQSSVTDTMYRFNCYGDDRNIGLCKLLDENVGTCNCANRPIIPFTYEGEEVFNNNKYSNAIITGRLECENGAYAAHIDVDVTETGTTIGDRRRRLLNSKRGRSRLLAMRGGNTS